MSARSASRDDPSFLVLRENRLAFAAVSQFGSTSTRTPAPPVVIYGPSGMGKSQLVRHAQRLYHEGHPQERVQSLTAGQFAEEFAEASAEKSLAAFVRKYRTPAGLFICEDLQALDGRRETQEQLIAIWNALVARQSRILVTLDRPPGELRALNPRLVNRLLGGVCVGIARYGAASRERLLGHFTQSAQLPLTQEQLRRLAASGAGNGHELQGLVTDIRMRIRTRPSLELGAAIDQALGDQPSRQQPSLNEIAKAVASVFGARLSDLRSDARDRRLAVPRQLAMHLMREISDAQYGAIGDYFGGRTHSTVLHGCRRIARQMKQDETLRLQRDQVCRQLRKLERRS
ncbi:MAG: hypothetical protein KF774_09030 [Planctomyces sp.]|nr:hypothetical protein [Planctomyces sp.]